jgi:transcriptional repressor NrdR
MRCPSCGHSEDKVVDSRSIDGGAATRRRRECESCGGRFTTYERVEESLPMIAKRDGRREQFDRAKLLQGIQIACRKREVSTNAIDNLADQVEQFLMTAGKKEIPSAVLGDRVMRGLKELDHIAYIRFASVYQSFENIEAFTRLLDSLADGSR